MIFLDMAAAFVIAAMAGLGIGSSGLLVLYLTMLRGMGQMPAQGMNLVFFIFAAGTSLFYHIRRRSLQWKLMAVLALSGCAGAWAGGALAHMLNPLWIRRGFGIMLIASGLITLFRKTENKS